MGRPRKNASESTETHPEDEQKSLQLPNTERFIFPEVITDIFSEIGEPLAKGGVPVKYTITKDGDFLQTMSHPVTLDMIQQKHGGGYYKIQLKNASSGKFLATQTVTIASLPEEDAKPAGSPENSMAAFIDRMGAAHPAQSTQAALAPQAPQTDFAGIASLIDVLRPKEQTGGDNVLLLKMMEMQQENQRQQTQMMLESIKNVQESTASVLRALSEKMEKLSEPKESKGETVSLHELIKEKELAEEKGYKKAMDVQKTANEIADNRLKLRDSLREELEDEVTEERNPKSSFDVLIQSLTPVIAMAMQAKAGALPVPARPQMMAPQAPRHPAPAPVPAPQAKAAPKAPAPNNFGLPRAAEPPLPTAQMVNPSPVESVKDYTGEEIAPIVLPALQPLFVSLQSGAATQSDVLEASKRVKELLKDAKIPLEAALKVFTREDVLNLSTTLNIPADSSNLLHYFYDELQTPSGS